MLNCTSILTNTKESDFNRKSASTLLVGSIRLKIPKPQPIFFWDTLLPDTRKSVKNDILNTLIDPEPTIVKAGANVISYIAVIEVPRSEWLEIVDTLAENTIHNNVNIRRASIITIGDICEVFHDSAVAISENTCQQFLGGIIMGSNETQDNSIVEASLEALRNSLTFMEPILKEEAYRNEVFKILFERMNNKNETEERLAYQALFEFSKACYLYLLPYLELMLKTIIAHIQQRNDNTILALELLDTIGT
jgi:importin subunit beta-1